jgi:hypothetical protein
VEVVVVLPGTVEELVVEPATVDEVVVDAGMLEVVVLAIDVVVVAPAQGFGVHVPGPIPIPPWLSHSVAERSWHCIPGRLGEGLGSEGLGSEGLGSSSSLGDGPPPSPPSPSSRGLAAPFGKQHWMGISVVVVVDGPTTVVVVATAPHGSGTQLPSPPMSTPPCAVQSLDFCGSQTNAPPADDEGRQQSMSPAWRGQPCSMASHELANELTHALPP